LQFGLGRPNYLFFTAGPTIIIGIALGISSVNQAGALHLNDDHKVKMEMFLWRLTPLINHARF